MLAGLCRRRALAWDCATGNGQVAAQLAAHFDDVVATDASPQQIAAAAPYAGVDYRVATAEDCGLADDSVDLITVAQALHWFDSRRFFDEARRVARPEGVLAAWCYQTCTVSARCDAIIDTLYAGLLSGFWPPERRAVEQGYAGLELPGHELAAPEFAMRIDWDVDDMLGYLGTWSACRRYRHRHGEDPVRRIEAALRTAWGDAPRTVSWPLKIRVCRLQ